MLPATQRFFATLSLLVIATVGTTGCSPKEEAKNPFDVTFTVEKPDPNGNPLFREIKPGSSQLSSASPLLKSPVELDKTYNGTVTYDNQTEKTFVCETWHEEYVSVETGQTGSIIHFDTLAETESESLFDPITVDPESTVTTPYSVKMPALSDEARARDGEKLGSANISWKCVAQ